MTQKFFSRKNWARLWAKRIVCLGRAQLLKKHLGVNAVGLRFIDNIYTYDDVIGMINKKLKFAEDAGFVFVP